MAITLTLKLDDQASPALQKFGQSLKNLDGAAVGFAASSEEVAASIRDVAAEVKATNELNREYFEALQQQRTAVVEVVDAQKQQAETAREVIESQRESVVSTESIGAAITATTSAAVTLSNNLGVLRYAFHSLTGTGTATQRALAGIEASLGPLGRTIAESGIGAVTAARRFALSPGAITAIGGAARYAIPAIGGMRIAYAALSTALDMSGRGMRLTADATDEQRSRFRELQQEADELGVSLNRLAAQRGVSALDVGAESASNWQRLRSEAGKTLELLIGAGGTAATNIKTLAYDAGVLVARYTGLEAAANAANTVLTIGTDKAVAGLKVLNREYERAPAYYAKIFTAITQNNEAAEQAYQIQLRYTEAVKESARIQEAQARNAPYYKMIREGTRDIEAAIAREKELKELRATGEDDLGGAINATQGRLGDAARANDQAAIERELENLRILNERKEQLRQQDEDSRKAADERYEQSQKEAADAAIEEELRRAGEEMDAFEKQLKDQAELERQQEQERLELTREMSERRLAIGREEGQSLKQQLNERIALIRTEADERRRLAQTDLERFKIDADERKQIRKAEADAADEERRKQAQAIRDDAAKQDQEARERRQRAEQLAQQEEQKRQQVAQQMGFGGQQLLQRIDPRRVQRQLQDRAAERARDEALANDPEGFNANDPKSRRRYAEIEKRARQQAARDFRAGRTDASELGQAASGALGQQLQQLGKLTKSPVAPEMVKTLQQLAQQTAAAQQEQQTMARQLQQIQNQIGGVQQNQRGIRQQAQRGGQF